MNNLPIIVGLTGGIGSGKSTVAHIFNKLGYPVYDSDSRAKALYSESQELKEAMIFAFGKEVYIQNQINRPYLAKLVFQDEEKLSILNKIVHPFVKKDFLSWVKNQNSSLIIREAAILIESGAHKDCDKIITVEAPRDVRIKRVVQRDASSIKEVESRISKQLSDEERRRLSDYIIHNDGTTSIIYQVQEIVADILNNQ